VTQVPRIPMTELKSLEQDLKGSEQLENDVELQSKVTQVPRIPMTELKSLEQDLKGLEQ